MADELEKAKVELEMLGKGDMFFAEGGVRVYRLSTCYYCGRFGLKSEIEQCSHPPSELPGGGFMLFDDVEE